MLRFHVSNKREQQEFEHPNGAIEFGRGPRRSVARCVIQDLSVSRDHVYVEETPDGNIRVDNLSTKNPIRLADGSAILPGCAQELFLPTRLIVGETTIDVRYEASDPVKRETLETIAQPFRGRRPGTDRLGQSLLDIGGGDSGGVNPEKLTNWFETVISVQKAAAGSAEFYDQTARALVDLVGLDRGLVMLRHEGGWEVIARSMTEHASGREYSQTILNSVLEERRTFYQSSGVASTTESLQGIEAVVASPIFDAKEQVVGALYGSRNRLAKGRGIGIGSLEAQVVQLLAAVVSAGMARLDMEAAASRMQVQFEQFFTADLAREMQSNPKLLEGQDREITVMFSDVRGFSRLSEKLGPRDTCKLVSDIMDRLTVCIRQFKGVLVDYMGDGLLAMWNAPADQPDHAELACRAALAMQAEVPRLSADWQSLVGGPLAIGIGLNTGAALVGNTGSKLKFKYGPLGHTVNLASRVEGATKQLGIPALITGSTRALLGDSFATRRLGKYRVLGIVGAIDLYELHAEGASSEWLERRDGYEHALALYEAGRWADTCQAIYPLLAGTAGQYDIPCLDLVSRAVECLKSPPADFDPVQALGVK